jgi:purine-nucleoside phosphorylase
MRKSQSTIYQNIREAVEMIQSRCSLKPEIGIVLGSGLGMVAELLDEAVVIPYGEIPHFHPTAIEGHIGQLLIGKLKGIPVAILQGRFHFYEGYAMEEVVFPCRTICALGVHTLILTNAAGGINTQFGAGDLMLIEDHLNLMGDNPLKGPNLSQLGPRFPDLSEAYSKACLEVMKSTAKELEMPIQKGIYGGLLGPTYETPAEVRMLRVLGADAVGMSTVPETIAANHLGVQVVGISCITNLAAGLSPHKLSHLEVIEISKKGGEKLCRLLAAAIPRLAHKQHQPGSSSLG